MQKISRSAEIADLAKKGCPFFDHFAAAGYDIRTNGSKQIDWERAKRYSWYYDDDNQTPILRLQAPNTHEVAEAVVESIKDYFRK